MTDSPSADLCTVNNKRWRGDLPLVEWTEFDILYTFKIQNIVLTALYFSSVVSIFNRLLYNNNISATSISND